MKKYSLSLIALFCIASAYAETTPPKDTLYTELRNDIVILSTTKETNSLKSLPAAVSVFSPLNLEASQIHSLKDLSALVPNYFVADYGSKMTAPIYIRGIGARSGTQTASIYIDNIPSFNTTSFDCELFDIQRVEVLRGTQGTLYGRNAMGGIINIYTFSPLDYDGTSLKIGGGSHGQFSVSGSHYNPLNNRMGFSLGGYYRKDNGYFTNKYTGNKVDDMKNAGGRFKFAWKLTPRLSATYSFNFDYVDQGAFPYANTATDEIDYNSEGYYKRKLLTNGISLRYSGKGYEINSTTGYQYLNDEMNMDQDYTRLSMFYINQKQRENSLSQEITIKSDNKSNYQWSNGIYGFYDYLHTTSPVYMMEDGISRILQPMLDRLHAENPRMPQLTITDDILDLNSDFERPIYGAAVFHQSTFNNLLTEGLSVTLGLRLDYEKAKLDYNSNTIYNYKATITPPPPAPSITRPGADTVQIVGSASKDYLELLPKAVVKYQFNPNSFLYASASRGYKAGGHNIQLFADLLQEAMNPTSGFTEDVVSDRITYKPEYSWNYEFGGQVSIIDNALSASFALYYMDVRDVQITQFVKSGGGRMLSNAGKAVSKGFEVGLKARPCNGFYLYANYGLANAKFKDYEVKDENGTVTADYSNNHIPFAPQSTFSVGGTVSKDFSYDSFINRVTFDTNFSGIGRVYWQEDNVLSQGFYGTLDARLAFEKSLFTLEIWGKNILDRDYDTFLFESNKNYFAQRGRPARWGASIKVSL